MLKIGLVRICAGGVQKWTSLPRTSNPEPTFRIGPVKGGKRESGPRLKA